MKQRKKPYSVAVHIQSEVQFFSLAPLLEELRRRYERLEIVYEDFSENDDGYREMVQGVCDVMREAGYSPKPLEMVKDVVFDVYLTPYIDKMIQAKCYLKYEYGTLNIKPSLTYSPDVLMGYHGFLCQSTVTSNLLRVYGATFPVDNLRFYGKKRKIVKSAKKRVLVAPTYNDQDDEKDLAQIIEKLREKYYVIVKGHHGTTYLKENGSKRQVMSGLADEYYDSETSLSDLIMSVDVCLFGNSSAIGEALYAGVPCAIFAKDLDCFKIANMHTTQYNFVQDGFLPYTNDANEVVEIVEDAMKKDMVEKQRQLARKVFPDEYRTGVDGYLSAIDYFLTDDDAQEYIKMHNYVNEEIKKKIDAGRQEVQQCKSIIARQQELIDDMAKRKLYKVADKIYKIEGRFKSVKS